MGSYSAQEKVEQDLRVRRATPEDAQYVVDLCSQVQRKLTESGSLQEIGPLILSTVQVSIEGGFLFLLARGEFRIGAAFVEPLDGIYPNTLTFEFDTWNLESSPRPVWLLHTFMIDPKEQGKGLGLGFLEGISSLVKEKGGTIVLDCWAGNCKLREFYSKAGFTYHGVFPKDGYEIAVFFTTLSSTL